MLNDVVIWSEDCFIYKLNVLIDKQQMLDVIVRDPLRRCSLYL